MRSARGAGAGHRDDDPFGAVVNGRLDQVAGRILVDHDHIHARQLGDLADVEFNLFVVPLRNLIEVHHAIAIDHAKLAVVAAAERLEPERVGLGHVARGVDLVVEDHEHALIARLWIGGDADAFEQIGGALIAHGAGIAHRPDHHHRPRVADGQVQEERRFLQRVGAARHDNPGEVLIAGEGLVDAFRQAHPLLECQLAAGHVGELFVRELGETLDAGHRFGQLRRREAPAVAVGDGAAGGHKVDARQGAGRTLRDERRQAGRNEQQQDKGLCHTALDYVLPVAGADTRESHLLSSCAASSGVWP